MGDSGTGCTEADFEDYAVSLGVSSRRSKRTVDGPRSALLQATRVHEVPAMSGASARIERSLRPVVRQRGRSVDDSEVVEIEFVHDREVFVARVGEQIRQVAEFVGRQSEERRTSRTFTAGVVAIQEGKPEIGVPWQIVTDGKGLAEWHNPVMVQGQPRKVVRA